MHVVNLHGPGAVLQKSSMSQACTALIVFHVVLISISLLCTLVVSIVKEDLKSQ